MKRTLTIAMGVLASAVFAHAQASTTTIQIAASNAGPQASAAAYQATVDAAVAHGAKSSVVAVYENISNQTVFGGSNANTAFKSSVSFGVSAAQAGAWEIRSGVDFGNGGALFIDGVALDFKSNDMWWAGNYNNASQHFSVGLNLAAGNHTLNLYGLENCCDGTQQAQFKFGGAGFTSFSANDGLIAAVPEPETYAMLLAGLGLIGFTARRRRAARQATA